MATELTGARQQFYVEDVNAGVSVSQALAKKLASATQFINDTQVMRLNFGAVGSYYSATMPQNGIGLEEVVEFDCEIVNIWCTNGVSGSSGTTEVDLKKAALNSGTYNTIFTTTPKWASTSANKDIIDTAEKIASVPTGVTRPVLNSINLSAGDKIRFDIITAMVGGGSVQLNMHIRPR